MDKIVSLTLVTLIITFIQLSCSSDDLIQPIDCSQSTLSLSLQSVNDASSCTASDGRITVNASGGEGPYTFEIGSVKNDGGTFDGLAVGNYEVKVTDVNLCFKLLDVSLSALGSSLSLATTSTPDTDCLTENGTITATEIGGVAPYEFRLNNGVFGSSSTFNALKEGNYNIEVRDSQGCSFIKTVTVEKGETGVSFSGQIKPIIDTKCALSGCHNGDNGANRNWTVFSNVKSNAANIKTRTGNRSMPLTGSLTQEQIDLIACWVDDGARDN